MTDDDVLENEGEIDEISNFLRSNTELLIVENNSISLDKIVNFYNIEGKNRIRLILDEKAKDKDLLQKLADQYGSFQIFPIRGSKYNLIKFDKVLNVIDDENLKLFYHFTDKKYPSCWSVEYLSFEEIFVDCEQVSENLVKSNIYINQDKTLKTQFNLRSIKKEEKFYRISLNTTDNSDISKYIIIFNLHEIIIYHYINEEKADLGAMMIKDALRVNFYIIDNDKFLVNYVHKNLSTPISISFKTFKLIDEYIIVDDFFIDCKNKNIKLIGDFDSKYTEKLRFV